MHLIGWVPNTNPLQFSAIIALSACSWNKEEARNLDQENFSATYYLKPECTLPELEWEFGFQKEIQISPCLEIFWYPI